MKKIFLVLLVFGLYGSIASELKNMEAEEYINLDKECEEDKIAKSCLKLGVTLYTVHGDDLDSFFVQNYSRQACDVGGLYSSFGCEQIANTYHNKAFDTNTTSRNYYIYMAKKYYKKACESREEIDCKMLEIIDNQFKNEEYKKEWQELN